MIVACPSCNTRYRYRLESGAGPTRARCSQCDARFPLVVRRSYVMLSTGPGAGRDLGAASADGAREVAIPAAAAADALRSTAGRDGLTAFLLGSLGALGGYYGALFQAADVPTWTAAGAGAGMVLGWAWFRWRAPRH